MATRIEPGEQKESEELVTIGLYCKEANAKKFDVESQIKQIEHIRIHLTKAATTAGKPPPKFNLSVLLVPDWDREGNSYRDKTYLETHKNFFKKFREKIEKSKCGFKLQDAYTDASKEERGYLHKLKNMGANADWIKTHALVAMHNQGVKHLQLDSNTQISDYLSFYNNTFGQNNQKSHDGLNASAYDENYSYVSAHNKVVYVIYAAQNSKIIEPLRKLFSDYCRAHQGDDDPEKNGNSIYSKVFNPALAEIGLVTTRPVPTKEGNKIRYLVNFNEPEYELTRDIITAVNMSWAASSGPDPYLPLKQMEALKYPPAEITFPCFLNLVNVYSALFEWHLPESIEIFRTKLHNRERDIKIIRAYCYHISEKRPELLSMLVSTIPKTKNGEKLCLDAFSCTTDELVKHIKMVSSFAKRLVAGTRKDHAIDVRNQICKVCEEKNNQEKKILLESLILLEEQGRLNSILNALSPKEHESLLNMLSAHRLTDIRYNKLNDELLKSHISSVAKWLDLGIREDHVADVQNQIYRICEEKNNPNKKVLTEALILLGQRGRLNSILNALSPKEHESLFKMLNAHRLTDVRYNRLNDKISKLHILNVAKWLDLGIREDHVANVQNQIYRKCEEKNNPNKKVLIEALILLEQRGGLNSTLNTLSLKEYESLLKILRQPPFIDSVYNNLRKAIAQKMQEWSEEKGRKESLMTAFLQDSTEKPLMTRLPSTLKKPGKGPQDQRGDKPPLGPKS